MTKIMKSIHKVEYKFGAAAENFFFRHPLLGYLTAFIGVPLFILTSVLVCTMALTFPFAFLCGWF